MKKFKLCSVLVGCKVMELVLALKSAFKEWGGDKRNL